jgi:hypothetical protein
MPSLAADVVIEPLDAAGMHAHRDDILDLYRDAYADKVALPFFSEDRYWDRLDAYAARDTFGMVVARQGAEVVGCALGYTLPAGSRWWEGLTTPVAADLTEEDGSRTFALNYIMVRQSRRRNRIAKALHDTLMSSRTEQRATLLVLPDNVAASAAYASWGWERIGGLQPFEDAPTYDAMILTLP